MHPINVIQLLEEQDEAEIKHKTVTDCEIVELTDTVVDVDEATTQEQQQQQEKANQERQEKEKFEREQQEKEQEQQRLAREEQQQRDQEKRAAAKVLEEEQRRRDQMVAESFALFKQVCQDLYPTRLSNPPTHPPTPGCQKFTYFHRSTSFLCLCCIMYPLHDTTTLWHEIV